MRKFKAIEKFGSVEVLEETLSDGSHAYSVRFIIDSDHREATIIDCISEDAAYSLAEEIHRCASI